MSAEPRLVVAALLACALSTRAVPAGAQACCAGSSAVTPARLGVHEQAAVFAQLRATSAFGSFDGSGAFVKAPPGTREIDVEQALYGAVRAWSRGQLVALVPVVETHRATPGRSETGGGLGDVNLSARHDLLLAGEPRWWPGVGLLAGVTLPTGRAPDSARRPLATDATGLGAVQLVSGVALEQWSGPWSVGLGGLVAWRAPRNVGGATMELAPQLTLLGSLAYSLYGGSSVALTWSFTNEGQATVRGERVAGSARRWTVSSASFAWPMTDQLYLLGSVFFHPPVSALQANQTAAVGTTLGIKWGYP